MTANMNMNLKPKEAAAIIHSLMAGVVPKLGIQHVTVGRTREIAALLKTIEDVKNGQSVVRFWIGEFGSGKSFMLFLLKAIALKQNFVTASVDFSPGKRLYSRDRRAVHTYSSLIDNLSIQTKPEGGALVTLLEKWIRQVMTETAAQLDIPPDHIGEETHIPQVKQNIMKTIDEMTGVGGFDFGMVVLKYFEGYVTHDDLLCKHAVKWLKGEYTTKTEARQDLGVRNIVDDTNYYDMLKNFARFFTYTGYSGFMVNLDEAGNLYKISHPHGREKNYEQILSIYNDCFQGKVEHLLVNIAGTEEFLENDRRGLYSYQALKTRLAGNPFETLQNRDFDQPVIRLLPLDHEEVFVLLQKIKLVFNFHHSVESAVGDDDIHLFMEALYNRPGANEFLTPREVIKDFLSILSLLRQNPGLDKDQLIKTHTPEPFAGEEVLDTLGALVEEF
jgi:hypothetical protein